MAQAVLQTQFYGDDGLQYSIVIYDRDATYLSIIEFDTEKGSNILTDDGDDNDTFKRIITKKFSTSILLNKHNYTSTQRTALVNFYNNLCDSPEGRFYIQINQDTSILFRGKILADIGDLTLNYHRILNITATDGMAQLKGIDYKPPTSGSEYPRMTEHIARILMKNEVAKYFWGDDFYPNDAIFSAATFWTCNEYSGSDILRATVMYNHYYDLKKNYKKYWNCYDVLEDILTGFNARILFADGMWHVEQLGYLDNLNVLRTPYKPDGTLYSEPLDPKPGNKITHNITASNDIEVLDDLSLKRLVPFKAVSLIQNKAYNNTLAGSNLFFHRTDPDNRIGNLGYQITEAGTLVGDLVFECEHNLNTAANIGGLVCFEIQIKLGNYYLSTPSGTTPDFIRVKIGGYSNENWALESLYWTDQVKTIKIYISVPDFYTIRSRTFQFDTDPIPEDGELTFTLVNWYLANWVTLEPAPITSQLIKWSISPKSKLIVSQNNLDALKIVPDKTTIYEIGDTRNTLVYETKLRFYDEAWKEAGLLIKTAAGSPGIYNINWTTLWTDPDMGEALPIQKLVMKQILGMRSRPQRIVRLTLQRKDQDICHFDDRYAINSEIYIPMKSIHNLDNGTYDLSLWKINKDFDGINVEEFSDIEENKYVVAFDNNLNSPPPSPGEKWILKYSNVTATTIVTTADGISLIFYFTTSLTPESIDNLLDVYKNGVRLEYVDTNNFTFPLSGDELGMNQYTFDIDTDTFYFAYNEGDNIVIKYTRI